MRAQHDAACKSRLLVAYYILDQQHALLFGRQRSNCASVVGMELSLPEPFHSWDAFQEEQAAIVLHHRHVGMPANEYVYEAVDAVNTLEDIEGNSWDAFQSLELLACVTGKANVFDGIDGEQARLEHPERLLLAMEQSSRIRLAYHTSMLCRNTPVRELLAVAGETWVLSEKLRCRNEYLAAQIETRTWADGTADSGVRIHHAVQHALQIIDIVQDLSFAQTGLLFEKWAVYLAALVIWAKSYVAVTQRRRTPSLSIPSPSEPKGLISCQLGRAVRGMVQNGLSQGGFELGRREGSSTLLWAKERIATGNVPHSCGITNGALDVLGKLNSRGYEDGWF